VARRLLALFAVAVAALTPAAVLGTGGGETLPSVGGAPAEAAVQPRAPAHPRCPLAPRLRSSFEAAALETGLPLALLVALGQTESGLREDAVSGAGAVGLLQVLPSTASELGLDAAHSPSNVLAGARYLRAQLDRFRSVDLALAAYHAGPTAVQRAAGAPTGATIAYIGRVTSRWLDLGDCR
jgi:soluble lytic murein transglycosylase-like protein